MKSKIKAAAVRSKYISSIYYRTNSVVKIHGCLRTGTNYLQKLLEYNFKCRILKSEELGWKHGKILYYPHFKYIVIARCPFAWATSFYNWEQLHKRTNENSLFNFLKSGITHTKFKNEWRGTNPIDNYNKTYLYYMNFIKYDNIIYLKYEDLLTNLEKTLELIGDDLRLSPINSKFLDYKSRADNWKKPKKQNQLDIEFYRQRKYLLNLDLASVNFIRNSVSSKLLQQMGYDLSFYT